MEGFRWVNNVTDNCSTVGNMVSAPYALNNIDAIPAVTGHGCGIVIAPTRSEGLNQHARRARYPAKILKINP
jgi:hypothetical protein